MTPAHAALAAGCVLILAAAAGADGQWVLWRGRPGQDAARARVSQHATLADCLGELKSREEEQRAYLRATGEARPEDRLPPPGPAESYRCLPDSDGSRGSKGN